MVRSGKGRGAGRPATVCTAVARCGSIEVEFWGVGFRVAAAWGAGSRGVGSDMHSGGWSLATAKAVLPSSGSCGRKGPSLLKHVAGAAHVVGAGRRR